MKEVCINSISVVTGLGPDLESLWHGVMTGESSIRQVSRFSTKNYQTNLASCIDGLESKIGSSRIYELLEQLFAGIGSVPTDAVLITASTKGCIDLVEQSDSHLSDVLITPMLSRVSAMLGITSAGININASCASSTIAIARAASMIASGSSEAVIVVCMDLVTEFVYSGFSALKALSSKTCRPFDCNRDGLTLGEGAAALLLTSRDRSLREERPVLGVVAGWGAANDSTHITAPARDGCGLIQATIQALKRACIDCQQISAISAHGTATVYNDQMELTAFQSLFGERHVPMNSIKGAIGHTLGAAGGIEAALALKCLAERQLPPTVGLLEPEKSGIGFLSCSVQPISGDYLLSTNSGFGGVNGALILQRKKI